MILRTLRFAITALSAMTAQTNAADEYDLLIRNGSIIDGSGKAAVPGDVGVRNGEIVFVGSLGQANATRTIDATGLIVAPGFIDTHNHVLELEGLKRVSGPIVNEDYLAQGVTTIIAGPDGYLAPADMEAVQTRVIADGISTNYAFYVGHNGIRSAVLGQAHRAPTADELARMKQLVRKGFEMGAVGFSTGLMYNPGMFSTMEEVIELAKVARPFGGIYDTHTRNPVWQFVDSDKEAMRIGREAGIPVKLGHEKAPGLINRGKIYEIIALVEKERAAGRNVVADQYPYDGAASAPLDRAFVLPNETGVMQAPGDLASRHLAITDALTNEKSRAAMREATEHGVAGGFSMVKAVGYGNLRIVGSDDFPGLVGRNIELLARERRLAPFDLIAELFLQSKGTVLVTFGDMDEAQVRALMLQPWVMICSDGGFVGDEHPRTTGTFPRVLGHYVREEKILSLPEAIRKMTSLPADFHYLESRGRLAQGKVADIVIFDAGKIADRSTWADPSVRATGVSAVIVNGIVAFENGHATGALPGKQVTAQRGRLNPQRTAGGNP